MSHHLKTIVSILPMAVEISCQVSELQFPSILKASEVIEMTGVMPVALKTSALRQIAQRGMKLDKSIWEHLVFKPWLAGQEGVIPRTRGRACVSYFEYHTKETRKESQVNLRRLR